MRFTTINHFNYADADGSLKNSLLIKIIRKPKKTFVQASVVLRQS